MSRFATRNLFRFSPVKTLQSIMESHCENRMFWPAMAASSSFCPCFIFRGLDWH